MSGSHAECPDADGLRLVSGALGDVTKADRSEPNLVSGKYTRCRGDISLTTRGPWPKKKYGKLVNAHGNMLGALMVLASAYSRLEPEYCRRLERSDHLHPAFVRSKRGSHQFAR